jgi:AraC-like DNA-binding protein
MKKPNEFDTLKYFVTSDPDEAWGIKMTTAGFESMKTRDDDPILAMHPSSYRFKSNQGRILNEYQIVYITEGRGVFKSSSCDATQINAGTMFLLFPGEWHSYYPDPKFGWKSYWIGFNSSIIDKRLNAEYFSKKECVCNVGISETIINLYKEVILIANEDKIGSQNLIGSIALHILGLFYYKNLNHNENNNTRIINKLNKARTIMRENLANEILFEDLAKELGVGYSWFRRMFKKYEGISPAQYLIQLKIIKTKELLTSSDLSISEIAYKLGLESKSQLSTFFKKHEGISPSEFRKIIQS